MSEADRIWNRAAMEGGGCNPSSGDRALAALLNAHGLVMNGGVLHAVELLHPTELSAAESGYREFSLDAVVKLLEKARTAFEANEHLDSWESQLDSEYTKLIPDDSFLFSRFEEWFHLNPGDFSPLS